MSYWLDTQFGLVIGDRERGPTSMLLGPKFLSKLYKLSPPEVRIHVPVILLLWLNTTLE